MGSGTLSNYIKLPSPHVLRGTCFAIPRLEASALETGVPPLPASADMLPRDMARQAWQA